MSSKHYLITGGAGFIGTNLALKLASMNKKILLYDNLSRKGAKINLTFIRKKYPNNIQFIKGDIRDVSKLKKCVYSADVIFHLAAQVAVTTSVVNPLDDFSINAHGSVLLLELIRKHKKKPIAIFSSTNKVYGELTHIETLQKTTRYSFCENKYKDGISEEETLNFHSPYGCSKGSADQYFLDYSKIYGVNSIVFRQSCIYGPHQFGVEDQGWVAWFFIAALLGKRITIYGDGKQVRDLLYVDDLINAYLKAVENIKITRGKVYNVGGGIVNSMSVWQEFSKHLNKHLGYLPKVKFMKWRPGDQKIFVSNNQKLLQDINWQPVTSLDVGLEKIYKWISENEKVITNMWSDLSLDK